jgi:hypothetical protein
VVRVGNILTSLLYPYLSRRYLGKDIISVADVRADEKLASFYKDDQYSACNLVVLSWGRAISLPLLFSRHYHEGSQFPFSFAIPSQANTPLSNHVLDSGRRQGWDRKVPLCL